MSGYMFDRDRDDEWARLEAQARILDPGTIRHLEQAGVRPGAHVAEIAGGAGSIADWMCRAVGVEGRVLATDQDTRRLERLDHPNLDVRKHDIADEPLPEAAFDVVHCRLLLIHLKDKRQAGLANMIAALRPGGVLLVEDIDMVSRGVVWPEHPLQRKAAFAFRDHCVAIGVEAEFGRKLWRILEEAGLEDVGAEGRIPIEKAPSPIYAALFASQRDAMIEAGRLTAAEADEAIGQMNNGFGGIFFWPSFIAAWGRRPRR